ncbi:hypothetical protein J2S28_005657 [Rhizobium sp. SLBN-94]|nr:hypothetical protein [Rhizobium sp. SLBN-94]
MTSKAIGAKTQSGIVRRPLKFAGGASASSGVVADSVVISLYFQG